MKIYNSATHTKEEFVPHEPGKVSMYTCGPNSVPFCSHRQSAQLYHGGRAGEAAPLCGL